MCFAEGCESMAKSIKLVIVGSVLLIILGSILCYIQVPETIKDDNKNDDTNVISTGESVGQAMNEFSGGTYYIYVANYYIYFNASKGENLLLSVSTSPYEVESMTLYYIKTEDERKSVATEKSDWMNVDIPYSGDYEVEVTTLTWGGNPTKASYYLEIRVYHHSFLMYGIVLILIGILLIVLAIILRRRKKSRASPPIMSP